MVMEDSCARLQKEKKDPIRAALWAPTGSSYENWGKKVLVVWFDWHLPNTLKMSMFLKEITLTASREVLALVKFSVKHINLTFHLSCKWKTLRISYTWFASSIFFWFLWIRSHRSPQGCVLRSGWRGSHLQWAQERRGDLLRMLLPLRAWLGARV